MLVSGPGSNHWGYIVLDYFRMFVWTSAPETSNMCITSDLYKMHFFRSGSVYYFRLFYQSVNLHVCLETLILLVTFDLYKVRCLYLVCIFLEPSIFSWRQHWLLVTLTLWHPHPHLTPPGAYCFTITCFIFFIYSKAGISESFEGHQGPITGIDCHKVVGAIDFSPYFVTSSFDWTIKLWSIKVALSFAFVTIISFSFLPTMWFS